MRVNDVLGWVMLVTVIGAGLIATNVEDRGIRAACTIVAVAMVVWWGWKGHLVEGWVGSSYKDMVEEISRLERLMARWEYPDGSSVPADKRDEIVKRHQRLIEKIRFHPEAPDR